MHTFISDIFSSWSLLAPVCDSLSVSGVDFLPGVQLVKGVSIIMVEELHLLYADAELMFL